MPGLFQLRGCVRGQLELHAQVHVGLVASQRLCGLEWSELREDGGGRQPPPATLLCVDVKIQ